MSVLMPLDNRVVVKPIEQEEKTSGGIIIPDTAKEKPMQGEVIAVGKGSKTDGGQIIPMEVQIGDKVLYGKWAGNEIDFNGQKLMIMKESDIMAIVK